LEKICNDALSGYLKQYQMRRMERVEVQAFTGYIMTVTNKREILDVNRNNT
jgi:hypothetical protein